MTNSYTTLWTQGRCRYLRDTGYGGKRLSTLIASGHQSLPSFLSAGLQPGDHIFPVSVTKGRIRVLGRLEVARSVSLLHYQTPEKMLTPEEHERFLDWYPDGLEGCAREILVGTAGTPLDFETVVPPTMLERLTYTSRRGERTLKYVEDGLLKRFVSLQGVYRLAAGSAAEMHALVRDTADRVGPDPRTA
ncbi:hypothetical protein [Streptodolium elevatio]